MQSNNYYSEFYVLLVINWSVKSITVYGWMVNVHNFSNWSLKTVAYNMSSIVFMLSLGCILISDLVADLFMPGMILFNLAVPFLYQKCFLYDFITFARFYHAYRWLLKVTQKLKTHQCTYTIETYYYIVLFCSFVV